MSNIMLLALKFATKNYNTAQKSYDLYYDSDF